MDEKSVREDRSIESEIRERDFGYLIRLIMDEKNLTIAALCVKLQLSKYKMDVHPSHMRKMLRGIIKFRADYLWAILEVAEIEPDKFIEKCQDLTEESMKSGRLYYKRPYHRRKDV